MATISKRKNKSGNSMLNVGLVYKGRRKSKSFPDTVEGLRAAKRWEIDFQEQVDSEVFELKKLPSFSVAVEQYIDQHLKPMQVKAMQEGRRGDSRDNEKTQLAKITSMVTFGSTMLDKLNNDMLVGYERYRYFECNMSAATVRKEVAQIRQVVKHGCNEHDVVYPFSNFRHITPKPASRKRLIQEWEIEKMMLTVGYSFGSRPRTKQQYVIWLWLLAIESGMRMFECMSVNESSINYADNVIWLPKNITKTKVGRHAMISERGEVLLRAMFDGQPNMFSKVCVKSVSNVFSQIKIKAGLSGDDSFTFHDSRHLFCTRAAQIPGISAMKLALLTGHENIEQLSTYYNGTVQDVTKEFRTTQSLMNDSSEGAALLARLVDGDMDKLEALVNRLKNQNTISSSSSSPS